jgi:hypothetical protein
MQFTDLKAKAKIKMPGAVYRPDGKELPPVLPSLEKQR